MSQKSAEPREAKPVAKKGPSKRTLTILTVLVGLLTFAAGMAWLVYAELPIFAIPLVVLASGALAQQQGQDACARDVSRFCRAVMNQGDSVVLGCLKANRARLSKACERVLIEHGQ